MITPEQFEKEFSQIDERVEEFRELIKQTKDKILNKYACKDK